MREENLMKPIRFRFNDEGDKKRYGDDWYVYSEADLARLPARELIKLEQELGGLAIPSVMDDARNDKIMGNLAVTWWSIRRVDPDIAGPFDSYQPLIMLVDWQAVPAEEEPAPDPLERPPSDGSSPPPPSE